MELSWLAVWGASAWLIVMLLRGNNTETRATSCATDSAKSGLIGINQGELSCHNGGSWLEPGGILFGPSYSSRVSDE